MQTVQSIKIIICTGTNASAQHALKFSNLQLNSNSPTCDDTRTNERMVDKIFDEIVDEIAFKLPIHIEFESNFK